MNLMIIENVSKKFGGIAALKNLDLAVEKGKILGVIGPNGAGKTTLINVITGYEKVDAGKINYDGKDISKLPPHVRARHGIVRTFQIPRCFAGLTVLENIMIPVLLRHSRGEAERRARSIAERMLLGDDLHKQAETLPVGGLKLLELARAYAASPRILLLDEPMGGLSQDRMEPIIRLIREMREDGLTIILVEHVMKAVVALADILAVLNFGERLAHGRPCDVMKLKAVRDAYLGEGHA